MVFPMPAMEFDEYEYPERAVEDPAASKADRRSSGDAVRSSRHPRSEDRDGGDKPDRERSSSRRDKEHRHREDRDHGRDRDRRDQDHEDRHHSGSGREEERARSRDVDRRSRDYDKEREERKRRRRSSSRHEREAEIEKGRARSRERTARERELEMMERDRRYIEFYDAMSVPHAIALSGHLFLGQPVMVKPSEAEKNLVQSTATAGSGVTGVASDRKLYVGNLHYNITEILLRQIFEAFGPVELVQLPLDPDKGHCKGYGFVQFAQLEHAKATRNLNGTVEIAGRTIKVSAVTDHVAGQNAGTNAADFDDEDGTGLALNARSRVALVQKLDRTGTATSIAESLGISGQNGAVVGQQASILPINRMPMVPPILTTQHLPFVSEPIGEPSECLLLKNMFDPSTEMELDFDLDIKEEVEEECSKFGPVRHLCGKEHQWICISAFRQCGCGS